jgi:hypothetical protein
MSYGDSDPREYRQTLVDGYLSQLEVRRPSGHLTFGLIGGSPLSQNLNTGLGGSASSPGTGRFFQFFFKNAKFASIIYHMYIKCTSNVHKMYIKCTSNVGLKCRPQM